MIRSILLGICVLLVIEKSQQADQVVKISLYYEAGHSPSYVTTQLYPTYKLLADSLQLDLVPFGREMSGTKAIAKTPPPGPWSCPQSILECKANAFHSCAIANYPEAQVVEFINCALSEFIPTDDWILERCSTDAGMTWLTLELCFNDGKANALLENYANRTSSLVPPLAVVPTIIFNDVFNQTLQDAAVENLTRVVCDLIDNQSDGCQLPPAY